MASGRHTLEIDGAKAGVFTVIASKALTGLNGSGTLRFEVDGTSLKLFLNGVLQLATTNGSISAAGLVGVRGRSAAFANFQATAIVARAATLPFTDSFVQPDNADLNPVWTEQAGAFTIHGNAAVPFNGNVGLATVNASPVADDTIQTAYTLNTSTGSATAGLVARYSGTGDTNASMYLAMISYQNGVYTLAMGAYQKGVWTSYYHKTLTGAPGSGTLQFSVIGSTLQLFLNGALQLSATDHHITTPGLVGIRGRNAALTDFSA